MGLSQSNTFLFRITIIFLTYCLIFNINDLTLLHQDFSITLFNNSLLINKTILIQETIILLLAMIILIALQNFNFKPEVLMFFVLNIISAHLILESSNLLTFFISWEIFNLSLYILFYTHGYYANKTLSITIKYFLLSALSTNLLLFAFAILYHITGSIEFNNIAIYLDLFQTNTKTILNTINISLGEIPNL
jgi:NADH:ubiquinone oxidoreductase subunit 2 (subunit N)